MQGAAGVSLPYVDARFVLRVAEDLGVPSVSINAIGLSPMRRGGAFLLDRFPRPTPRERGYLLTRLEAYLQVSSRAGRARTRAWLDAKPPH
jgi:hypothetical protein